MFVNNNAELPPAEPDAPLVGPCSGRGALQLNELTMVQSSDVRRPAAAAAATVEDVLALHSTDRQSACEQRTLTQCFLRCMLRTATHMLMLYFC